jgi:hypothetical protein
MRPVPIFPKEQIDNKNKKRTLSRGVQVRLRTADADHRAKSPGRRRPAACTVLPTPQMPPTKAEPCLFFSQEQFRPQSGPALVCNPAGGENEKRLRQRTATIRREQTEKNATNKFEKSNYLNVLGFKHLVDIEGVTGSIPSQTARFRYDSE